MSGGLRELKKQRTREAIQNAALRLYREQGYVATTLEQVAAEAEVSLSTLFRYFPTKPDAVLYDRVDPIFVEELLAQPADLPIVAAMRGALRSTLSRPGEDLLRIEGTRMDLIIEVPEVRAAATLKFEEGMPMFIEAVAHRTGREPDDPEVHAAVGAVAGAAMSGYLRAAMLGADAFEAVDASLQFLEDGMPF